MNYQEFSLFNFNQDIQTEEQAIDFLWKWKLDKNSFNCVCGCNIFYQLKSRAEVRECKKCGKQHRLRSGTIFQNSKVSLKRWLNALLLMMSGKRGISALELQKHLGLKSYKTAWGMLLKIRNALIERDANYSLNGRVEVDGSQFGSQVSGTDQEVIIGVETKEWVDDEGETHTKAGFAQVMIANENKENAKKFVEKNLKNGAILQVDGAKCYEFETKKVVIEAKATLGNKEILSEWHRWMHRFVSNAKIWILGTHHGINPKYLQQYLGEYTYRFNRRHDSNRLFSRALSACLKAKYLTINQIAAAHPAHSG